MLSLNVIIEQLKTGPKSNRPSLVYYQDDSETLQIKKYRDLTREAENVSVKLKKIVHTSQNYVGICMKSCTCLPVIIMGCIKSGLPFVCIETDLDLKCKTKVWNKTLNLSAIFTFSDDSTIVKYVLKSPTLLDKFDLWGVKIEIWISKNYENKLEKDNKPNIIYAVKTSGTTGEQKIVQVPEHSIMSNIYHLRSEWNVTSSDVILLASPPTFDPFMVELLLAWLSSAAVMVIPSHVMASPSLLLDSVFTAQGPLVTIAQLTPSVLMRWSPSVIRERVLNSDSNLRILALGGEPFPSAEYWLVSRQSGNRTQLFSLYGTTELSCWAMIARGLDGSLGKAMSHTLLQVQDETGNQITNGIGQMFIGSETRICVLGGEHWGKLKTPLYRATGDVVSVQNGVYYYIGRIDNVVKRYGHRVSLEQVENIAVRCSAVASACCVIHEYTLALFICLNGEHDIEQVKEEIKQLIIKNINKASVPDLILKQQALPLNAHGKINRIRLTQTLLEIKVKEMSQCSNPTELFVALWKRYTLDQQNKDTGFISAGGNSITAMQLVNEMTSQGFDLPPTILNQMLNNKCLTDCCHLLQYHLRDEVVDNGKGNINQEKSASKRIKIEDNVVTVKMKGNASNNCLMDTIKTGSKLIIQWFFDLNKCIDAVPSCIVYSSGLCLVVVGSHSGKLAAINIKNGVVTWETTLPDRIESSVTPSLNGTHGLVGCYDCNVYCISLSTGSILWHFKTQGMVKGIPLLANDTWIFGSYDYCVYCLKVSTGSLVWQYKTPGLVLAAPILINGNFCVVATLSGHVIGIGCTTGIPSWVTNLQSPVFSTPCLVQEKLLLVAEVEGILHCLNPITGSQIWQFNAGGNIFSSLVAITKSNTVLFGCHDHRVYCLRCTIQSAELLWSCDLGSPVYSTPCLISSNHLVAATTTGRVVIVELSTGSVLYTIDLMGQIFSSPVILNNSIVIGCRDNCLYCIIVNQE